MVALWMIGYEDRPEHSGEMCVFEIFGRDVTPGSVSSGMGVHPFGDPSIVDDFERVHGRLDASEFHDYAADWTPSSESLLRGRASWCARSRNPRPTRCS